MTDFIYVPFVITLLIAVSWTTVFSLTNNPSIRGFRNLGILASYALVFVFIFVADWKQILVTWVCFGIFGGLIYTLWEVIQRIRSKEAEKPSVGLSHILYGLFTWPIMIPEAIEYCLAEFGVFSTGVKTKEGE
jgi:hypothetical protein